MRVALTRCVSPRLGDCELTHLAREPIDVQRARDQHAEYERALERMGCDVRRLAELPDLPDAVFVEDAAIVFDEIAVVTRPGAESRRSEVASVQAELRRHRDVAVIDAPATIDGGDVLVAGRAVYVGVSGRTNADAVSQLRSLLAPHGYIVTPVAVRGCLHLKSAATLASPELVLLNPDWIDASAFRGLDTVALHPTEPMAANVLRVGDTTLCAAAYPRTRERLEARGIRTDVVDTSELAKAEGALTCCSLIFSA